jgi:hypothetical protein
VIELARYQEGPASVVVSRDGDNLVFWSSYDDYGRTITEESRIAVADFVAKGEGPWPWYDLGDKREGTLMVLDALGVDPPAWTTPLSDQRARPLRPSPQRKHRSDRAAGVGCRARPRRSLWRVTTLVRGALAVRRHRRSPDRRRRRRRPPHRAVGQR